MRTASVIFDVDGTLVDSKTFDDELYGRAIRDVLGPVAIRSAWNDYPHVTDSGILREICQENGLDPGTHEAAVRHRFGQLIEAHLAEQGTCRPIRGGPTLFEALRRRRGLHIGIATGGWEHTALMKLRAAGYEVTGVALASADDAFVRTEILDKARTRLPVSEMTVYVGDGDWDRRACESLGWTFVGIGDGVRGQCQHWMPDLSMLDRIDAVLRDP